MRRRNKLYLLCRFLRNLIRELCCRFSWALVETIEHIENWRRPVVLRKSRNWFIDEKIHIEGFSPAYKPEQLCQDADRLFKEGIPAFNLRVPIDTKGICWQRDINSGYSWNRKYTKYLLNLFRLDGSDALYVWQVSRFQFMLVLGKAYLISRDEKYTRLFLELVANWIKYNPCPKGVNWANTMEVAIRVCNWIGGYYLFKDSPVFFGEIKTKSLKSIWQHGQYMWKNLENKGRVGTNHYLSDVVGLLSIGVMFSDFKNSKKWTEFGVRELERCMEQQVCPDGVDFEASTCYHRLVLELFFFSTLLVVINDREFNGKNHREITEKVFGKEYTKRLHKMFEFVLYALKPNGKMPQIGDNDSSRLHIFANREILDMRYLLTLGAIFFKEPKFKIKEFGFCEEALWIFGEKGYKIWQDLEENWLANIGSKAFPDAGWYTMRNNKDYMIISCGSNGQNANGGHCHNDKLSFELCIGGHDIIVDPGTYVYTAEPEWRNKFRSTAYHNTVVVDGEEQNRFDEKSLFEMKNDAEVKCLRWETSGETDIFIGEHYGYKRLSQLVIHKREIKFHKKEGKLEIIDEFKGEGEHNLEWNLILSPEFRRNLNVSSDKLRWHREPAFYSSEYGTITKTEKLTSTLRATIPVKVKFWMEI